MNNSDTRTSAASNKSQDPAPSTGKDEPATTPEGAEADQAKKPAAPQAAKAAPETTNHAPKDGTTNDAASPSPGPTDLVRESGKAAPAAPAAPAKAKTDRAGKPPAPPAAKTAPDTTDHAPKDGTTNDAASPSPGPTDTVRESGKAAPAEAREQLSQRIAHPVPHHSVPEPDNVEEVLKSPEGTAPGESPLRHLTDKKSSAGQDATGSGTQAVSGGFTGLNNWLDSLPEPNLERLGDRIYAAPATFKKRWHRFRIERAKAAELKEQERLLEVARAEAKAEAAKREATRLAHQAKLDAAARQAADARIAAQAQADARAAAAEEARLLALDLSPSDSPVDGEPELHAGNLLSTPADDWDPADHDAPGEGLVAAGSGTTVASTPAPPMDPEQLAALVASAKAAIDHQQTAAEEPVYVAPYVLPETGPNPAEEPADVRRRILGSGAALAAAVVSLATLETLSSGTVESLGSNHSLLSLAPTAHLLWPVIFVWALLGAAYSWAPSQRSAVRQRAVGHRFALACAGNVLWMLSVLNDWLFPAFGFAAASCWFLYTAVRGLNLKTARTPRERMLTDAPVSLMTGFSMVVLVSTFMNMLASWGAGGAGIWIATLLVPALGYVATSLSMTERGRIIMAIGFGWGMFWLLVPRVLGANNSIWVAILAGMAGFVVLLATENRRYQIHHAEHRAARGKTTDFS
ncbi:hypothetical protein ACIPVK_09615 [Paeniglutamicibacter sp. MACA_103]|uniref:hypothetical protein n=1 Tax=Paeniglutamicibacter sp. MACA_103 TaxID=3377337 RepID=UPI003893260B